MAGRIDCFPSYWHLDMNRDGRHRHGRQDERSDPGETVLAYNVVLDGDYRYNVICWGQTARLAQVIGAGGCELVG